MPVKFSIDHRSSHMGSRSRLPLVVSTAMFHCVGVPLFPTSERLTAFRIFEMNLGIICACIPVCAAAFQQPFALPRLLTSWFSRNTSSSSDQQSTNKDNSTIKASTSINHSDTPGFPTHDGGYGPLGSNGAVNDITVPATAHTRG